MNKQSRPFNFGMLLVLLAACLLPVQACLAATNGIAVHAGCPDCPQSAGAPDDCHCVTMATAHTLLSPVVSKTAHGVDRSAPVLAIPSGPASATVRACDIAVPPGRPPGHSPPSALNIRFCSFQK